MMRVLLIVLLIFLYPSKEEREVIVTKKKIIVSGETSIGGFNCDFQKNKLKDTLYIDHQDKKTELNFEIPVKEFSCGNFLLNNDFRKTIKAEDFPHARVKVKNLVSNYGNYSCNLYVDIVGKHLFYEDLILNRTISGVEAFLTLSFEDLDLQAPKKMGGLIKVEEALDIRLELTFE